MLFIVRNLFLFLSLDCIIVTQCWFFCCIFVIFLSNNKGLRFNSYPVSLPIFSFLPLVVYPRRDNILVLFFMNNFVTVWTKFNTTMRTYTILLCTKFRDNQITHLRLMKTFIVWRKEEKQTTKKRNNQTNKQKKKTKRRNSAYFRRFTWCI